MAVWACAGTVASNPRPRAKAAAMAQGLRRGRVVCGDCVVQRCMVYIQGLEAAFYKMRQCHSLAVGVGVQMAGSGFASKNLFKVSRKCEKLGG